MCGTHTPPPDSLVLSVRKNLYPSRDSDDVEYKEKIMVAESDNLTAFHKIADWEITPPDTLGQKNDFRDPQAYYEPDTDTISLTITASKDNVSSCSV